MRNEFKSIEVRLNCARNLTSLKDKLDMRMQNTIFPNQQRGSVDELLRIQDQSNIEAPSEPQKDKAPSEPQE